MKKSFGQIIKDARIKNKLTMQMLVNEVGTSTTYITKIENYNELPSKEVVENLCKVLDLNFKKMSELVIKNKVQIYEQELRKKYKL